MKFLAVLKKSMLGILAAFFVFSGLLVGAVLIIYLQDRQDIGVRIEKLEAEDRGESDYVPIYKRYEEVYDFHELVEEAAQDMSYGGIWLHISSLPMFEKIVIALHMIEEESKFDFQYITEHTDVIVQAKRTYADGKGHTYIKSEEVMSSILRTAEILMHEATHHTQDADMSRTKKEREAIANSIDMLEEVEAPQAMLDWLEEQDGKHWDVDGDGHRSINDFLLQDW